MTIETYEKAKLIVDKINTIREELKSWKLTARFSGDRVMMQDELFNILCVRTYLLNFEKIKNEAIQSLEKELEKLEKQIEEI